MHRCLGVTEMIPVILSGGSGSRLWPLSRKQFPKQFLALTGDDTLFQQTIKRLRLPGMQPPLLVCNQEHRFIVQEQLKEQKLETQATLLEPFGRNTAPAVAIEPAQQLAQKPAEHGEMVLFGIPASRPETGYGYIRSMADDSLPRGVVRVQSFVEKPDEERARAFVESGDYFWNSGMFLFRASRYLEELKQHEPDIYDTCLLALERSTIEDDVVLIDAATFECCPDNSIDYAVMEKTSRACLVPLNAGWNDVGSWSSIWDVHAKDSNGNVTKGDVMVHNSRNCLVHGNGKLVSVIGLDDQLPTSFQPA